MGNPGAVMENIGQAVSNFSPICAFAYGNRPVKASLLSHTV